jgi:phosphoglycerol transferase MdoB-like AlkP superfamily enzyme
MPNGAVPYMQYVDDPQYSLAWAMKEMGYYTIAMHPYYSSGWNRTNVYPNLGFDKMMFMDDFTYEQSDLQRDEYMTDSQAYANLIEQIEQAPEGQKVFAFLITVQNHAGYTENLTNFEPTEYFAPGTANGNELALNVYLTCLKQSDVALEELLTYLSEQDEKYTVMMFGDHQPQFMSVFPNNFAPGVYTSWTIPYMIWTNYDMDPELKAQYENDPVGITSINYLSIDTLKAAGVDLPGYYQLLEKMREKLPCINSAGYYSNSLGAFGIYGDPTDADTQKILDLFHYIQYNLMFDKESGEFKNSLMNVVGG